jgi:hypothetical protein
VDALARRRRVCALARHTTIELRRWRAESIDGQVTTWRLDPTAAGRDAPAASRAKDFAPVERGVGVDERA